MSVERVVTAGTFSLDGEDFDVENNVWIVGGPDEVVVIDAAHDHLPILEALAGRAVVAIVATHGHNDHINAAVALADATSAPILLHPADEMLWRAVYPDRPADGDLTDGQVVVAGTARLEVLHTPGHSLGGCCLFDERAGVLLSGDTLFKGGPGATGRSFSDKAVLLCSIEERLLTLPGDVRVLPGHGDETTIAAEAPSLPEWLAGA